MIKVADGGDGTVPSWSALLLASQHEYVGTEHAAIFTDKELRRTLYRLPGSVLPGEPWGLAGAPEEIRLHLLIIEQDTAITNPPTFSRTIATFNFTYQGLAVWWLKLPIYLPSTA